MMLPQHAKGWFVDLQLSGLRAVVTGGTRGIGRAVVEHLLAEGCRIAFCARTPSQVDQAVKELMPQGEVRGTVVDVGNDAVLADWIAATAVAFGGLDIVVSNVSAQSFDWRASVDVDVLSAVRLMDFVEPHLRRSSSGAVVAIASMAGHMAVPSYKPYSAVKAALVSFMGSLSREWAPVGVRVNVISPGEVYYPGSFWERMRREEPGLYTDAVRRNIMGRMADPADVARAVAFLASPAAAFISGVNLFVDGAAHEFVDF
jgi:NAD(P)-dependent dehydrogenase (short-subunit alcohol dehydrogenase family)